jgi:hypothetical protein
MKQTAEDNQFSLLATLSSRDLKWPPEHEFQRQMLVHVTLLQVRFA